MTLNLVKPLVLCHGGAQKYEIKDKVENISGCLEAVMTGMEAIKSGNDSVTAVVETVKVLENNEIYNAGTGACLNEEGSVELDSMVMDGTTMNYGAIIGCKDLFNPVGLAKELMYKTPHCILAGAGVVKFANSIGYPICTDINELICQRQKIIWKQEPNFISWLKNDMDSAVTATNSTQCTDSHDTVGAVAVDFEGNLACATSTGGINGKMLGRIGDAAIIGCGGYANDFGAAVATGHGESLLKSLASYKTVSYMQRGYHPSKAAEKVLLRMKERFASSGGIICVNKYGEYGSFHTTGYLPWAIIDSYGNVVTSN